MSTVLFVCRANRGRSVMSAALFERAAEGRHRALSAGTTPGERVHPEVVTVMRELGIDLANRVPRKLTRELAEEADVTGMDSAATSAAASRRSFVRRAMSATLSRRSRVRQHVSYDQGPSSTAASSDTRRAISSRAARTSSSGRPFGSSSSQSR